MTVIHLARRFFGALRPGGPSPEDSAWAAAVLTAAERPLFDRLPAHDRRHAITVARDVAQSLGPECEPRWLAAALLHDVGKQEARLNVTARVVATTVVVLFGRARVSGWTGGWRGRVGAYARHGELGAAEIRAAGGREEAAAWSEAHHRARGTWEALGWPETVVRALDAADNA